MTALRERIMAAIARAEETGLARESYPVLDCRPAENLTFLLYAAAACLRFDELLEDPAYDQLRLIGPDEIRKAAFDDLDDWEKRAVVTIFENASVDWEEARPKVDGWLAKLEAQIAAAA